MDVDPHANAGYVIAAYCITALILAGYALRLWLRSRKAGGSGDRSAS